MIYKILLSVSLSRNEEGNYLKRRWVMSPPRCWGMHLIVKPSNIAKEPTCGQRDRQTRNPLSEGCNFDDWLWAHMIHGAEWLRVVDRMKINDPSLLSLLRMGVLDWKAPNNRLHQATQVIRHGTAIALRFLLRIMKLESRVRRVIKRRLKSF